MGRNFWAEINLDHLAANVQNLKRAAGDAGLMAVVKANAYGHGARRVARVAVDCGAKALGVALLEEGTDLRAAGFSLPILVMGLMPPDRADLVAMADLSVCVCNREAALALSEAAVRNDKKIQVHVKVDTGMGRLGISPDDAGVDYIKWLQALQGIKLAGIFTHFATADEADKSMTRQQYRIFKDFTDGVTASGLEIPTRHAANSAALLDLPETHLDMVRPGISLYGLYSSEHVSREIKLRPVMSLTGNVSFVKRVPQGTTVSYGSCYTSPQEENLATLPAGYADGFCRGNSPLGTVLVGGKRRLIAGKICMDQFVVSCGDDDILPGDEFVIMGAQGGERIGADELAERIGSINYEIICMVGGRVPRRYLSGGQLIAEEYLPWGKA